MAKRDNKPAAHALPTEPAPAEPRERTPAKATGRELAAAKTKGTSPKVGLLEQQARRKRASEKKGRDRSTPIDYVPLLTAKRALVARQNQPIVSAFLAAEKLRGGVRKLSRLDWQAELAEFTKAPR